MGCASNLSFWSDLTRQPLLNQDSPQSTRSLLLGLWTQLSRHRRLQLCLLLSVMLCSGLAELLSLGAVLPFMAVLSDPQQLWNQPLVQELAVQVGWTQPSQLLLPTTLSFAAAAVLAALVQLMNLSLNGRLASAIGSGFSCEACASALSTLFGACSEE